MTARDPGVRRCDGLHLRIPMARSLGGRTLSDVGRPVDAVTVAVLKLQLAQRAVNTLIDDVIDRVSADPFANSSVPNLRLRLAELRGAVDDAADELMDALARLGEEPAAPSSGEADRSPLDGE